MIPWPQKWYRWSITAALTQVLLAIVCIGDETPEEIKAAPPLPVCQNWRVVATAVHGDYPANNPIEVRTD